MAIAKEELTRMNPTLISAWWDIEKQVTGLKNIAQNGLTEKLRNDAKLLLEELAIML